LALGFWLITVNGRIQGKTDNYLWLLLPQKSQLLKAKSQKPKAISDKKLTTDN